MAPRGVVKRRGIIALLAREASETYAHRMLAGVMELARDNPVEKVRSRRLGEEIS